MDNKKYILPFSAKSEEALENTSTRIINYIKMHPEVSLANASWTLHTRRREYHYRKAVRISRNDLKQEQPLDSWEAVAELSKKVIFTFPGTGDMTFWRQLPEDQYSCSIQQLFTSCCEKVLAHLPSAQAQEIRRGSVSDQKTSCYLAYLTGYALNQVLIALGVNPSAYIGEGLTELTAMTCAGALTVDHAIDLIERYGEQGSYQDFYQNYQLKPRQVPIMVTASRKAKQHLEQGVTLKLGSDQLSNRLLEACLDKSNEVIALLPDMEHSLAEHLSGIAAHLWCMGIKINWCKMDEYSKVQKIILPTYVFDKVVFDSDVLINNTLVSARLISGTQLDMPENPNGDPVELLKTFWQEAVGSKMISEHDDFFQIGGDSLTAIMLAAKIREQLNAEISLSDIFANATFKQMSNLVLSAIQDADDDEITILEKREFYETSSAQKRMFAVNEFVEEGVPYNFADVYSVNGRISKDMLSNAFQMLVNRHEVFRTRFDMVNGEVVQRIEDVLDFKISFIDSTYEELKSNIEKQIRPFDLYQAPLIRTAVISMSEEEHVVVIDMHHIIADQTSLGILVNELSCIYQHKPLPNLEIQYKDFAQWQNDYFRSGKLDAQMSYWKNEFKDGISSLSLPTDYDRPEIMQYEGDKVTFCFDSELSQKIHSASAAFGVTPYMLMLAALNILLWKYTKQTTIPIGTAVAGRKHSKLSAVVGMFVNTLVINSKVEGSMAVGRFIQYIKTKMLGAYDNQDFQFDMLIDVLNPPKNLSRNTLFDVFLNYINVGAEQVEIDGNKWLQYQKDEVGVKQDLGFVIEESSHGFLLDIEYSTALYRKESAVLMGERFVLLLTQLLDDQSRTLEELSVMTEAEQEWLLHTVNQTLSEAPLEQHVISLFENCVRNDPGAVAMEWEDQQITYGQLNTQVNQLAARLAKEQVMYRDIVPILLDWGPQQIISMLAVMKLGAAYLPIDPTYPQERIDFIVQDSDSRIVITDRFMAGRLSSSVRQFIMNAEEYGSNIEIDSGISSAYTPVELTAEDICYVIYTSGSTGHPKGVQIRHKNVVRTVKKTNYVAMERSDRVIQICNYVFDASVMNIYLALLNQACLVLIPKSLTIEIAGLAKFIKEQRITVFALPTALFHLIAEWDVGAFKNVRRMIVGGEQMSWLYTKRALSVMGAGRLVNGYGPTESTVIATYYPINDLTGVTAIPIGYPVSNTSVYVLDEHKNLTPIGIPGELHIGGEGLAAGYLNRPELTREKFFALPLAKDQMVYATGDMVLWNSKRELIFVGRKDFQIKINGYRVELEEIERYIEMIDGLKKAVVTAPQDHLGNLCLKAYCTLEKEYQRAVFDGEYIRVSLKNKLPEYMIPQEYVILPEFPLNHNGKIDKKALAEINATEAVLPLIDNTQMNLEGTILQAMKRVLNHSSIGIKDNFFDVGGQSIRAIAMIKDLLDQGLSLKVNDIFQYQTAEKLAAHLRKGKKDKEIPVKIGSVCKVGFSGLADVQVNGLVSMALANRRMVSDFIRTTDMIAKFPLAPIQSGHYQAGSALSGTVIEVEGRYGERDIKDAVTKVILDNQMLRACLVMTEEQLQWLEYSGSGFSAISRPSYGYLDILDYSEDIKSQIVSQLTQDILTFQYDEGELRWNLCIVKWQQDHHLIIWGLDHLIFDGTSAEILKSQIFANLNNEESAQPIRRYSEYVELLYTGPIRLNSRDIIGRFALEKWKEANNEIIIKQKTTRNKNDFREIKFDLALNKLKDSDIWGYATGLVCRILEDYFEMRDIPLVVVSSARAYGKETFYNTVGEFLDLIPVLSSVMAESVGEDIFWLCQQFSINFLTLLDQRTQDPDGMQVADLIGDAFGRNRYGFDFILLNFQGFVSKQEDEAFSRVADDSRLARTVITIHHDRERLFFEIDDRSGMDQEKITEIAKEQIGEVGELD